MKQIDDLILSLMNNKEVQKKALSCFRKGQSFDIINLAEFPKHCPYIVSENVFESFINFASRNKINKELYQNVEPFITNKENITDKIFNQLLDFAKDKNEWVYLGLCHADLPTDKVAVLKSLNLDESFWY